MSSKKKTELTGAQKKALREASSALNEAYAAARKKVAAARIPVDEDALFCLVSPRGHCKQFLPPKRGFICARAGCRHSFARHNVF
jgi:hypothetical protein